jgi:hypothetical protein
MSDARTRTETFEGYFDHHAGWEFDMPVIMVKPRFRFLEAGSAMEGIGRAVEDFIIDAGTDDENTALGEFAERERKACLPTFSRVKRDPRRRKGATYWKLVVCWDTETLEQTVLEAVNCEWAALSPESR